MVGIECQAAAHTKSMATLGAYSLMNSTWANQVVVELNGLELVKKRGTGVDCSPVGVLGIEYRIWGWPAQRSSSASPLIWQSLVG